MRLVFTPLLAVLLVFTAHDLNAVVVKGSVVDEAKHPVPGAQIRALDGNVPLNQFPEVTSLQGQYNINLTSFGGTHLTLEVKAPGYVDAQVAVMLSTSDIIVGPIVLSKLLGLTTQPLTVSDAPNHKTRIFETEFSNEAIVPLAIQNIEILLSKEAKVDCLDISPAVKFVIDTAAQNPAVHISVPSLHYTDDRALTGTIENLPCGVSRVTLKFSLLINLDGRSHDHVRIDIPAEIRVPDKNGLKTVGLQEYPFVVIRFCNSDKLLAETKSF